MSAPTATTYEVRVAGHLDQHWSEILGGLDMHHCVDGTTTLTGPIADQSRLHGVLTSLQSQGVTLLSLQSLEPARATDSDRTPAREAAVEATTWPLLTDRLRLRPAVPHDAEATWTFRRMEEAGQWLTQIPADLDTYQRTFTDPERLATTLVIELDGHVIGDLMLRVEDAWAQDEITARAARCQAELAWVLDPAHVGAGYATEAVRELIRFSFQDLRLHRITAVCFADNVPSWRLMERVGMRREMHAVADALHRSGAWMDTYGYALLAEEWRAKVA